MASVYVYLDLQYIYKPTHLCTSIDVVQIHRNEDFEFLMTNAIALMNHINISIA